MLKVHATHAHQSNVHELLRSLLKYVNQLSNIWIFVFEFGQNWHFCGSFNPR